MSRLGSFLVQEGILNASDRMMIKRESMLNHGSFARSILAMGLLDEDELCALFASKTVYRRASKDIIQEMDIGIANIIPGHILAWLEVLPLSVRGGVLSVAMVDPTDQDAIRQLEFFSNLRVKPVIATQSEILRGLHAMGATIEIGESQFEVFLKTHGRMSKANQSSQPAADTGRSEKRARELDEELLEEEDELSSSDEDSFDDDIEAPAPAPKPAKAPAISADLKDAGLAAMAPDEPLADGDLDLQVELPPEMEEDALGDDEFESLSAGGPGPAPAPGASAGADIDDMDFSDLDGDLGFDLDEDGNEIPKAKAPADAAAADFEMSDDLGGGSGGAGGSQVTLDSIGVDELGTDMDLSVSAGASEIGEASDDINLESAPDDLGVAAASDDLGLETASDDLGVAAASDDLNLETASGDLDIAAASDDLNLETASGDLDIAAASDDLNLETASGDLDIAAASDDLGMETASDDLSALNDVTLDGPSTTDELDAIGTESFGEGLGDVDASESLGTGPSDDLSSADVELSAGGDDLSDLNDVKIDASAPMDELDAIGAESFGEDAGDLLADDPGVAPSMDTQDDNAPAIDMGLGAETGDPDLDLSSVGGDDAMGQGPHIDAIEDSLDDGLALSDVSAKDPSPAKPTSGSPAAELSGAPHSGVAVLTRALVQLQMTNDAAKLAQKIADVAGKVGINGGAIVLVRQGKLVPGVVWNKDGSKLGVIQDIPAGIDAAAVLAFATKADQSSAWVAVDEALGASGAKFMKAWVNQQSVPSVAMVRKHGDNIVMSMAAFAGDSDHEGLRQSFADVIRAVSPRL